MVGFVPPPFFATILMLTRPSTYADSNQQVSVLWLVVPIIIMVIFSAWFVRKVMKSDKKTDEELTLLGEKSKL